MKIKKKYYLYLLLALVILLFPAYYYWGYNRSDAKVNRPLDHVAKRDIGHSIYCNGQVDPYNISTLRLAAGETITSIATLPGEAVKKGQLLLTTNLKAYRSPLNGYLLKGPMSQAEKTGGEETSTLALSNLDSLVFSGTVAEYDLSQISPGLPVIISPGINYKDTLKAVIKAVEATGVSKNNITYYRINAVINNTGHSVTKTGFTATAEIIVALRKNVPSLKEEFIFEEGKVKYVYVVTGNDPRNYKKTIISTGLSDGIYTEIVSGLSINDKVCLPL